MCLLGNLITGKSNHNAYLVTSMPFGVFCVTSCFKVAADTFGPKYTIATFTTGFGCLLDCLFRPVPACFGGSIGDFSIVPGLFVYLCLLCYLQLKNYKLV